MFVLWDEHLQWTKLSGFPLHFIAIELKFIDLQAVGSRNVEITIFSLIFFLRQLAEWSQWGKSLSWMRQNHFGRAQPWLDEAGSFPVSLMGPYWG